MEILANVIFYGTMKLEYQKIWDLLDYLLWLYPKATLRIWNTKPLQKH